MTTHSFDWNGHTLVWAEFGDPDAKPMIFLHGWGSSSAAFGPLAKGLMAHRRCILLDFPGFGASSALQTPWTLETYADSTKAWLNHLDLSKDSSDLLVHSFGARVLLWWLTHPSAWSPSPCIDYFDKVIITGGAGVKLPKPLAIQVKLAFVRLLKAPSYLLPGPAGESYLSALRGSSLWKSLGSSDYKELSPVMRQTFSSVVNTTFDPAVLREISREMLLIWGEKDTAAPLKGARIMESSIQGAGLSIVEGAGHYPFLDKPKTFTAILHSYLDLPS
ncbi:MAG: alpha/beta hydrolase [Balneolaceae bacterium]|nr:alpha/beta hydrolase [Balneolaceae bacterium]